MLCVGYACMDLAFPFPGLPRRDRKHELGELLLEGGGPASTAAVALRRLGLEVGLLSAAGTDPWGAFVLERLEAEGVDLGGLVRREGTRTSLSIILADPADGARTILWNRGTATLTPQDVRERWRRARLVLVDEIHPEAALEALALAHRDGVPVLFDAGTAHPSLGELVDGVDYLVTSQHFPSRFTGLDDERKALRTLQARNGRPVVSTRGADGCWLDDGRTLQHFPAPTVEARDSTGAGDAFHAAFGFGLLQGWPLERCCRFANFYASQKCLALGGRAGLLRLDEVQEWLDRPS